MNTLPGILVLYGSMAGSALIALNIGMNLLGFCFFLASSIASAWVMRGATGSGKAILYQSYFFIVMNVIGIYRHL
jgi:hypothetical protein